MFKKVFLIFIFIGMPAFADTQQIDIAPGANVLCNASILGTTSGTVRLRANFVPEDIDLKWYDSNTQVNVSNPSNTCTYDTSINLPSNPTREGYTFKGWKIRPEYDFTNLNTEATKIGGYARTVEDWSNGLNCVINNGTAVICDERFNDLAPGEWKMVFDYGTVYGTSLCGSTSGIHGQTEASPNIGGYNNGTQYCWCKATGYKPSGTDTLYGSSNNLLWTFAYILHADNCLNSCALFCTTFFSRKQEMRKAMFGQS